MLVSQVDKKGYANLSVVRNKKEEFTASNEVAQVFNLTDYELILKIYDSNDATKAPVLSKTAEIVTQYKGKITIQKSSGGDDYSTLTKDKYSYELVWRNKSDQSEVLQQLGMFTILDID